jgi:hypothetical protein
VFVQDMEDMDVDQIEGSAGAADDTEGVRQRLLSERRAVKRHFYRVEHGIAYFLIADAAPFRRKLWLLPASAFPKSKWYAARIREPDFHETI